MNDERLDHFMGRANAAYYATRDPFNDFVTAPEISQVFGELLGAWSVVMWQSMGRPDPVILAECGPGRGTLMADAWRLIRRVAPDFAVAVRLHLVETSPRLRLVQQAALPGLSPSWHDRVEDLPPGPMILLANEFLDALPIRQYRRERSGWSERHVAGGQPVWREAAAPSDPHVTLQGGIFECCAAARQWVAWLSRRIAAQGGAALLLDYGYGEPDPGEPNHGEPDRGEVGHGHGDTLQALSEGAACDPFVPAGTADLTAHVDFQALRTAAAGARVHGPIPQGRFLAALGLFARIEQLSRAQPSGERGGLLLAAHRLADARLMGMLFKAMALCEPSLPTPPGFEEPTR